MKKSMLTVIFLSIFFIGCENIEFINTPEHNDSNQSNNKPIANAGTDKTAVIFTAVDINGSASDSDGHIINYEWKKGSQLISGRKDFSYLPTSIGNHALTLTVMDDDGDEDSDSMTVIVNIETNASN